MGIFRIFLFSFITFFSQYVLSNCDSDLASCNAQPSTSIFEANSCKITGGTQGSFGLYRNITITRKASVGGGESNVGSCNDSTCLLPHQRTASNSCTLTCPDGHTEVSDLAQCPCPAGQYRSSANQQCYDYSCPSGNYYSPDAHTCCTGTPDASGISVCLSNDSGCNGNDPACSTSGSNPGTTGSTPGTTGSNPGTTGSTPGTTGSTPGTTGSTPGTTGSTTGTTGSTSGSTGSTSGGTGTDPVIWIDLTQLEQLVSQTKVSVDGVKLSVDNTKSSVDNVKTAVDIVKSSVDTVKSSVDVVKSSVDGAKSSIDQTKLSVDGVKTAVDGTKSSVDGVKNSVDGVKTAVDSLKPASDAIKTAVDSAKDDAKTNANDLKSAIDGVKNAIEGLGSGAGGGGAAGNGGGTLQGGKTAKGFGDANQELEAKKQELKNTFGQVQNEARSLFTINSTSGGSGCLPVLTFASVWGVPLTFDMCKFASQFNIIGLCILFIGAYVSARIIMDK